MGDEIDRNRDPKRLAKRQASESRNLFSRLPAVYSASRTQGQKFLKLGGGLSIVEWRTLWDLYDAGPMTVRELAELQSSDHSLLSRALPEMRRKGFVTMERDGRDGRQTLVALAPAGLAAYKEAEPVMARRRQALREVFSEADIDTMVELLDRLEEFLRQPVEEILKEREVVHD